MTLNQAQSKVLKLGRSPGGRELSTFQKQSREKKRDLVVFT